ncbi:MAG: AraC family transcriptional regulator, partial [Pseudomonadota bacterium]|nr:AraC family transcriptional regulator [Pseudomonadota bacterium]
MSGRYIWTPYDRGQELCNDPALALHFGEAFEIAEMSIVGLLGLACETIGDAFAQMNRYERLMADVDGVPAGN